MSMPGFVFHFHCPACGRSSREYPLYVFPNLFDPSLSLPAWIREFGCYASIGCDLSSEDRDRLENDPTALLAFAEKLSSPALIVGVPRMKPGSPGSAIAVEVRPDPTCPHCGASAEARFGYSETTGK